MNNVRVNDDKTVAQQTLRVFNRAGRSQQLFFHRIIDADPVFGAVSQIALDELPVMLYGDYEFIHALLFVVQEKMLEPWPVSDKCHRLRKMFRQGAKPGSQTSGEK
jgi:hypothetical protein